MPDLLTAVVLPRVVGHADWGSNPVKRWVCLSERCGDGTFRVRPPQLVRDASRLLPSLVDRAHEGPVLIGFDFPIGLPSAYARLARVDRFVDVLRELGRGPWLRFYDVAERAEEISLARPFYPRAPGGKRQEHLTRALGVASMGELLRRCERRNDVRGAACPLFWTLGAKQVGRAAISGWRDVLAPALHRFPVPVRLWPFDGSLHELIAAGGLVVAETYPAEACLHLRMTPPGGTWSKTSQEGRRRQAPKLRAWASTRGVELDPALVSMIADGFGAAPGGEDPFDAVVGLLSVLEVVLGYRPEGTPDDDASRSVEGWILGQDGSATYASD